MVTPLQLLRQIEELRLKHLPGEHDQKSHAPNRSGIPKVSGSYPKDPEARRVSSNYSGGGPYSQVDAAIKVPVAYLNENLHFNTFASCEGHKESWEPYGVVGDTYDAAGEYENSPHQSSYVAVYSYGNEVNRLSDFLKQQGFKPGSTDRKIGQDVKKELYLNIPDGGHLIFDWESNGVVAFRVGTGKIDMDKAREFDFAGNKLKNSSSSYSGTPAKSQVGWDNLRDSGWERWMKLLHKYRNG